MGRFNIASPPFLLRDDFGKKGLCWRLSTRSLLGMENPQGREIQNRQGTSKNEDHVSGHPEPLKDRIPSASDVIQRPCIVVADADRVIELQYTQWKECGEDHPGQPQIQ